MTKLYYICNVGCDDETVGLVRISDEDFPKFEKFITNLNKNSSYGCMPTIDVYHISEDSIREATDCDNEDKIMYLDDKTYVIKDDIRWPYGDKVI